MAKSETVAEFLARGGQITKVPSVATAKVESVKSSKVGGPATIVTMDEADLYHGQTKKVAVKKSKTNPALDISALPEALRRKYIDEVVNAKRDEEDEDDF